MASCGVFYESAAAAESNWVSECRDGCLSVHERASEQAERKAHWLAVAAADPLQLGECRPRVEETRTQEERDSLPR